MYLITCEHAGNKVPRKLKHCFRGAAKTLCTHRGWDIGAYNIAKAISRELNAPFFFSQISRLVLDLNRSLEHANLFSEFTRTLPPEDKANLLASYYLPYHRNVRTLVARSQRPIIHLSIHSFTPELERVRDTEIGILFDPTRRKEKEFCQRLWEVLANGTPLRRVSFNYPYKGTDDGLTKSLRRIHPSSRYIGIEIEINQGWLQQLAKDRQTKMLINDVISAVRKATGNVT